MISCFISLIIVAIIALIVLAIVELVLAQLIPLSTAVLNLVRLLVGLLVLLYFLQCLFGLGFGVRIYH